MSRDTQPPVRGPTHDGSGRAQDTDVERLLERRSPLSGLMQESIGVEEGPSADLDAAIRAAARRAVASGPQGVAPASDAQAGAEMTGRRRPWWQAARVPMAAAATLVLTVSMTLLVDREQKALETAVHPPAGSAVEARAPSRDPVQSPPSFETARTAPAAPAAPGAANAPGAGSATDAAMAPRAGAPSAGRAEAGPARSPSSVLPPSAPPLSPAPVGSSSSPAAAAPPPAAPPPPPAAPPPLPAAPPSPPAPTASALRAAPVRPPADAAASAAVREQSTTDESAPAAARAFVPRSAAPAPMPAEGPGPGRLAGPPTSTRAPDRWLDEILELRRAGRQAEATEALAAFRKAWPGHPLPPELSGTP